MKIAYFTDSFYPHVDGVTTYLGVITRKLIKEGHEVMIVAPRWKGVSVAEVQKFVPEAKIVLVPGVKPFFYPDLKIGAPTPKSIVDVRKFAPDVIHFHTPGFIGFEASILSKLLQVPLITTFHTYYMEPEGFVAIGLKETSPVSKILQESLWKISESIHKPCDVVIAPTKYVGKDLNRRWNGVPIKVIPGAIETDNFVNTKERKSLRKELGFDDELVFLSVGRLSPEKHYDSLITSFSMMLMKYPNARLVFIGSGSVRQELEYIVKVLGIDHAVSFVGEIPYKVLTEKNYYSVGDVFVTPSTWDTQGLSVIEAMSSGLPVVAFKYRAMPEVVGKGGLLVKHLDQYAFATAMGKLAGDATIREELGKLAIIQSKKYKISTHVDKLLSLYKKLIEDKHDK
ncbi:glycosyltransferase [Candidatus Woesebacteria bacterium]|nr:glycosyltransferase [Candidatus Woesebacteria bacterium]